MNATEPVIAVGEPLPRIAAVQPGDGLTITVTWRRGSRKGRAETVDLAPLIMTFRLYRPLRQDPALFATVAVEESGSALVWGDGQIDMAAASVERLARERMTADDFRAFLARNRLTLDAAAAILGISRRQVAYFAKGEKPVPRLVALACAGYEAAKKEVAA
jgi:hypothetical protein